MEPSAAELRSGGIGLNAQMLIGAAAGIALGLLMGPRAQSLRIVGDLFIGLLRMVLIPLVFVSIATGIAGLSLHRSIGRVWKTAMGYFLSTSALAAATGLILVNAVAPGRGLDPTALGVATAAAPARMAPSEFLLELLRGLFTNPVKALAEGQVLPVVVFSLFLGSAMVSLGERARPMAELFEAAFAAILRIIQWVMRVAPVGVAALMAVLIGGLGIQVLAKMGTFAAVVIGGTLLHGFFTLPVVLRLAGGFPVMRWLRAMRPVMITAFSTASSNATLPITLTCVEKGMRVDPRVAGFVLPLGATVNMDGTALYEAMAALFIANVYGVDLTLADQLVVLVMAVLASIGAPGIPSAGMVTMAMVLQAVHLPIEGIALLLPIDRFLDAFRTMVNVLGDTVGAAVVQRRVGNGTVSDE